MEDQHHKLLEITMRNPQLCGIAISGAGCVGGGQWLNWEVEQEGRREEEDGGRKSEVGGGERKQDGGRWGRERGGDGM